MLLYTFYQPVFYATHHQHLQSESEERAAFWVGFGEHCGDAMTHKLLDKITHKVIYRSAVRPITKSNPNHRLDIDGGESGASMGSSEGSKPTKTPKVPTVFIISRQDDAGSSIIKPMPEFDPDNLIGRTFLLPPQENGERLRAKVTKKVVEEIEAADGNRLPNINFILDIGEGKVEELITYNQLLDHLEQADGQDNSMDQELYRFRAIIGHEGPLKATDPNWKGSKWNVQIEWETGEITFEPISVIAADDPITCAAYAKEKNLYDLDGWKRFRHLIKKEKQLTRAIKQSKIRQVRHAKKYMFAFLIPRNYTEALEFDKANNNSKWYDATKAKLDSIHSYEVFQKHEKAQYDNQKKVINAPPGYQKIRVRLIFAVKYDGRHKARLVADGHLTPEPVESIYSGVVSLRYLKLSIFLGKLNNLELWGEDIGNAYLEVPTEKKLYIVAGPEFEDWEGYILTFSKALYGLKSSGKRWAETAHDILKDMNFIPSRADQCTWLKKNVKLNLYEYIAVYVDDLCIAAQDPKELINILKSKYHLKVKGDGPLTYYLEADYFQDPDGTMVSQPKKYIAKLKETYVRLFNTEPSKGLKTSIEK